MPMNRQELLAALLSTADDRRLTRGERKALRAVLDEVSLDVDQRRTLRSDLLDAVLDRMRHPKDRELVRWLGAVLPLVEQKGVEAVSSRVYFGPADPMVETVVGLVRRVRRSLDVAMFTITDDRIAGALLDLHGRGALIRILTDDDKAYDRGSDIARLSRAGIRVAMDDSPHHFHHKFALFDRRKVVTGSYNWTRGADQDNRENFLVTDSADLVGAYGRAFDALWEELRRSG